jgi:CheY-like chemotaxis protein
MPIVDGLTSTKMIRSHEKSHPVSILSARAALNGRIPVFAVSASLLEKERQVYIDAGFDGWILKPIDFSRLSVLMTGIVDDQKRKGCLYKPGEWERGGWFEERQPDLFAASTKPDPEAEVETSVDVPRSFTGHGEDPFEDPISKEQERLNSLDKDAVQDPARPPNPGKSGNIEASGPGEPAATEREQRPASS